MIKNKVYVCIMPILRFYVVVSKNPLLSWKHCICPQMPGNINVCFSEKGENSGTLWSQAARIKEVLLYFDSGNRSQHNTAGTNTGCLPSYKSTASKLCHHFKEMPIETIVLVLRFWDS